MAALIDLKSRLTRAMKNVSALQEECKVASISVGVLHEGKVVLTDSVGFRDVECRLSPTPETLYATASISKTFVAAALGILVSQGKMKWEDKINSILEDFDPKGDPNISKEADFIDLLRHGSGLSNPVVSWLGPRGAVILDERKFMQLVNQTPTGSEEHGRFFKRRWIYSNINFGIAAKAVEKLSGIPYSRFVKEQLLEPLGMDCTAVSQEDLSTNKNIANPHFQLSDGSYTSLNLEWTSESFTSVLGAVGVKSSVKDLLIWCAAVMQSEDASDKNSTAGILQHVAQNPLREMDVIRCGFWTRPDIDDGDDNQESSYCLGWFKDKMPSAQVGWGSGNTDPSSEFVIGKNSPKRLLIKHTGIGVGLTASVMTFPESGSAVVALCNGYNSCDAADFAAQELTQVLFDLQPRVDIVLRAKQEFGKRRNIFHGKLMLDWLENRDISDRERSPYDFIGDYVGLAITLSITKDVEKGKLQLFFNGRTDIQIFLEYYNKDTYSFMPTTRDRWLSEGWLDWDYYKVGLLRFVRSETGTVEGLLWQWEEQTAPACFKKDPVQRICKTHDTATLSYF